MGSMEIYITPEREPQSMFCQSIDADNYDDDAEVAHVVMVAMLVMVRMGCCTCHGDSDGWLDKTSDAFFLIASVYWSLIYMNY